MIRRHRKGTLLVTILWITTLIMLMMATVGRGVLKNLDDGRRESENSRARYAAYAATQRILAELRVDPTWPGPAWPETRTFTMPQDPSLSYTCEVYNNTAGTTARPIPGTGVPGVVLPTGLVYMKTSGTDLRVAATVRNYAAVAGTAVQQTTSFDYAAVSDKSATLVTSEVNAFDRQKGKYDPMRLEDKKGILVSNDQLGMTLNSKVDGHIEILPDGIDPLTGNPLPRFAGDATAVITDVTFLGPPPGAKVANSPKTIQSFKSPLAAVTGKDVSASSLTTTTITDKKTGATRTFKGLKPGAYNNLTVEPGEKLTLTSGRYFFDKIDMDSSEILIDDSKGPVVIFVGKEMNVLNSSKVNEDGYPRALQVYFTDEKDDIDPLTGLPPVDPLTGLPVTNLDGTPRTKSDLNVAGGSHVTMVTAGGHTDVVFDSNSELFGAAVAHTVSAKDSKLHYDQSLKGANLGMQSGWVLDGLHDL